MTFVNVILELHYVANIINPKRKNRLGSEMNVPAVVFGDDQRLSVSEVELTTPGENDVVVDVRWSGISTGTEKLLWTGEMPPFPGLGYQPGPGNNLEKNVGHLDALPVLVVPALWLAGLGRCTSAG